MIHLAPKVVPVLSESDDVRISWIWEHCWIDTHQASQVLAHCEDLLNYPRVQRMPCLGVFGPSNAGKSRTLQRFLDLHPLQETEQGVSVPVVFIQAPPEPLESRLYLAIVHELIGDNIRRAQRVAELQYQAFTLLTNVGAKVLIIDEIHHVIAGPRLRQRHFLYTLKYITNELKIPLVVAGLDSAFTALNADEQLANRFDRIFLRDWPPQKEYLMLLRSFEASLPLRRPSLLHEPALALRVHEKTRGRLGEVSGYLKRCAVYAIRSGKEYIDVDVLDKTPYVPAWDRNKETNY